MVLFEIWSVARKPFGDLTNSQVLRLIQTGFCQSPPPGCPRAIYQLMVDCWYVCDIAVSQFSCYILMLMCVFMCVLVCVFACLLYYSHAKLLIFYFSYSFWAGL